MPRTASPASSITPEALHATLRAELERLADPERARSQQAYMKSALPFHGVAMPQLRSVCKQVFAACLLPDAERWREAVLYLWRQATHREERYAAIELSGDRRAKQFQTLEALAMYEELIVTGAWWDLVDTVAVHRIGPLLRHHPAALRRKLLSWSHSPNLWKRRTAIICQVAFKQDTDHELLYACIEPSLAETEFFLRKAIGWALRAYASVNPDEVVRYVREHEERLSGLSRREALKHVA